jgi:hypothetical protein
VTAFAVLSHFKAPLGLPTRHPFLDNRWRNTWHSGGRAMTDHSSPLTLSLGVRRGCFRKQLCSEELTGLAQQSSPSLHPPGQAGCGFQPCQLPIIYKGIDLQTLCVCLLDTWETLGHTEMDFNIAGPLGCTSNLLDHAEELTCTLLRAFQGLCSVHHPQLCPPGRLQSAFPSPGKDHGAVLLFQTSFLP